MPLTFFQPVGSVEEVSCQAKICFNFRYLHNRCVHSFTHPTKICYIISTYLLTAVLGSGDLVGKKHTVPPWSTYDIKEVTEK